MHADASDRTARERRAQPERLPAANVRDSERIGAPAIAPPHDPRRRARSIGLGGWLLAGAVLGLVYGFLNTAIDTLDRRHALGLLDPLHPLVDRILPVVLGMLFGLAVHFWLLRERTAVVEAARAEELALRLQHVERDQAVWVVATATLHDVRNPLHALGLLLEELEDEQTGVELVGRARVQVTRIERSLRALRALASEARPIVRPLSLGELVRAVAADLTPHAREASATLEVDVRDDATVDADPMHLRIALENLMRNAIESLRGNGRRVSVQVVHEGDFGEVRVSDDGPGVPAELRGAIFEPLTTTKEKGLGLGLPVARALARAMRGDVVLREREGWSTTFELKIPVSA
jgi:signal transduction histidine kinase